MKGKELAGRARTLNIFVIYISDIYTYRRDSACSLEIDLNLDALYTVVKEAFCEYGIVN